VFDLIYKYKRIIPLLTLLIVNVIGLSLEASSISLKTKSITPDIVDDPPIVVKKPAPGIKPLWVTKLPSDPKFVFVRGESTSSSSKDDALERAWISALLRVGMAQFPELQKLRSNSSETMKAAEYNRYFSIDLEKINWEGIEELTDLGSPYTESDALGESYRVYRLLRWSKKSIADSKASIKRGKVSSIVPLSPEKSLDYENSAIDKIQKIINLKREVVDREQEIKKILEHVRCGMKIGDIINIIGSPDRTSTCEYFWSTFKVFACHELIQQVHNLTTGKRTDVCDS